VARYTDVTSPNDQQVMYTTWSATGGWSPFAAIQAGVATRGVPAVAYGGSPGLFHTAFQGVDFKHFYARFESTAWSQTAEWVDPTVQSFGPTPPTIAAVPPSVAGAYEPIVAFFDGANSNHPSVQERTEPNYPTPGVTWSGKADLGISSSFQTSPAIVSLSSPTAQFLVVYVRQSDGAIVFQSRSAGLWSAATAISNAFAPTTSRLALAALPTGAIMAFIGNDGNLYYSIYDAGLNAWSSVAPFSTPNVQPISTPALAAGVAGFTAEIAFVLSDDVAYHARLAGGVWSTPIAVVGGVQNVAIASR